VARPALGGILVPVTTPFGEDGELAAGAFRENLAAHLAAGVDGIVVAGSTGEAPLLEEAERGALIGVARSVVPQDRWLVAGVGAESTRETVHRARLAADRGADAAIVVAPHYFAAALPAAERDAQLRAHYLRVADESPLPVVLYTIPKFMHFALAAPLVAELARHENVIGIKDSSGDAELLDGYLTARSERFAVLTGSGAGLRAALERGAAGGVVAVALFAPALALTIRDERAGAGDAAADAQARLAPLAREIVGTMGVAGVKAALDLVGLAGGVPRLPLAPATPAERARVAGLLASSGVLARAAS
jgi:4-hydroxy-2-oxoglutarate aldolase